MSASQLPVVFLTFANARQDEAHYLRNLPNEERLVRAALAAAERSGLCEVVDRANATLDEVLDVFQDARYRDRVAVFHFGGHAGSAELLFESPAGNSTIARAGGLARFLGGQRGLELVFLNGCSSRDQVQNLLDAGVAAVIATSQAIDDEVATEFSTRFYKALASGTTIRAGYSEAEGAVQARHGEVRRTTYRSLPSDVVAEEKWPWDLYVSPGAEDRLHRWSLPVAARDPLFGLPSPPSMDLPPSPFKHLNWFTRDDAEIFFGRGREVRDLYEVVTASSGDPVILFYGAAGAGKSSLLDAGLRPRLEATHEVIYLRRKASGLLGTLAEIFGDTSDDLEVAWRVREQATGKPLLVIIDQAEEAWTRPRPGSSETDDLKRALASVFGVREQRPRGRLILSFRKEWLAEFLDLLNAVRIPFHRMLVDHLDKEGIAEAISGPAISERLKRKYQLSVASELPAMIADDLLEDSASAIAPILQIVLTKMWERAREQYGSPRFTVPLYLDLKKRGILLDDFVEEQLVGLRAWRPELVDSGLVLDLLAHHTTTLGTAETCKASEVVARYGDRPEIIDLLEQCRDRHLLTATLRVEEGRLVEAGNDVQDGGTTRLAHDTLAPLVRRRFEASDLPGQRARRTLNQRAGDWANGKEGQPLDDVDLALVEVGQPGMRSRTPDEERLVLASRQAKDERERAAIAAQRTLQLALKRSVRAERRAQDRARVAIASHLQETDPTAASLVLLEVQEADTTPTAASLLYSRLATPVEFAVLAGHTDSLHAASFSPDGTRAVTASMDETARIWNVATGQSFATLTGHTNSVNAASFSPDGTRVLTASRDGTARIWGATTGQSISTLTGHTDSVNTASFSPDGTRVVTASADETARIWNVATGESFATLTGHTNSVNAASFSPDGTRVVTASRDEAARIWSVATGQLISTLTGHTDSVNTASFSPDGTRVVTASRDGTARIWNAETGQSIAPLIGHTNSVNAASFSPDGTRVVTASRDGTARIWNTVTGQPPAPFRLNAASDDAFLAWGSIATLAGHTDSVNAASFSPDGTRAVTVSRDRTARIWNVATGQSIATLVGHTDSVNAAAFGPDGTRVLTASIDETARIWNVTTEQSIATLSGHAHSVHAASFSPDGNRVATGSWDGTAQIWDVSTGLSAVTLTGHTASVAAASFSPDGERAVTASWDGTARIWNVGTGRSMLTLTGHAASVHAASFSPDGTRVVTASMDGTARIWNVVTGRSIATLIGHTDSVHAASFSPDGTRVVTASMDGTARIWNVATGESVLTLTGHAASVHAASFNRNGSHIVTASSDRTARIWNVATGESISTLTGHRDSVNAASFSPDGTRVVTASRDETARIWNVATGQPALTLIGHTGAVHAASFSPDGTRVVTASRDKTARIWPTDAELLQSLMRARSTICLGRDFREKTLGETPLVAGRKASVCEACVRRFFVRIEGALQGNRTAYVSAWRDYKRCVGRE